LISAITVIWLAATLAFLVLRVLPGDAIEAQLAQGGVPDEIIEQRHVEQGLSDPLPTQYLQYVLNLLQGNLGKSLLNGQPVHDLILQQLTPTLSLASSALVVASGLGLCLGVISAQGRGNFTGSAAGLITTLSLSMPIYWTGTLAIFTFSAQLDLLPSAGAGRLSQLILPVGVLSFHTAGAIARVVQSNVSATLGADFIRSARAKGLPERTIMWRHVMRASLLPVVTVIGLQAGFLFSGAVITESLFVRPGIGRLLLDSIIRHDYPVVQGVAVFSAVVYTSVSTFTDGLYRLLDPRVAA
jgi:ABC-type dipeptide/oligopeptide/nickel transport system permease component